MLPLILGIAGRAAGKIGLGAIGGWFGSKSTQSNAPAAVSPKSSNVPGYAGAAAAQVANRGSTSNAPSAPNISTSFVPTSVPGVTSNKDPSSLLQSTVKLLSKISGQLSQSFNLDLSRARSDRENFLERKAAPGATQSTGGMMSNAGNAGGVSKGAAAIGLTALLAMLAKKPIKEVADKINQSEPVKAIDRYAQRVGNEVTAVKEKVVGAVTRAKGALLGDVTAKYESGNRGFGAVSTGRGDPGGASYGKYQLASKTGTLQEFLKESGYGKHFAGKRAGSKAFNDTWKSLAAKDKGFGKAQHAFIEEKKYKPAIKEAARLGFPVEDAKIQEMIWSGAIQHGGIKKILRMVADHPNFKKMSVDQIVQRYYMIRSQYAVNALKRNGASSGVIRSVAQRMKDEVKDVLKMSGEGIRRVEDTAANVGNRVLGRGAHADITRAGKEMQSQGLRVGEQRGFGTISNVHKGRGHYDGRAIDVNIGTGNTESADPNMRAKFDALAKKYQDQGYIVLWNNKRYDPNGTVHKDKKHGHTGHMHVEVPKGGLRPRNKSAARAQAPKMPPPKQAPASAPTTVHQNTTTINGKNRIASSSRPTVANPSPKIGSEAYRLYFNTGSKI